MRTMHMTTMHVSTVAIFLFLVPGQNRPPILQFKSNAMSSSTENESKSHESRLLDCIKKYDLRGSLDLISNHPALLTKAVYDDQNTALHWASMGGQFEVVEDLVRHGADVNAKNADGETPLFWAVNGGKKKVLQFLFDRGASVDTTDAKGKQLYHHAASSGDIFVLEWARKHADNLSIDQKDATGRTPLTYACQDGSSQMTEWILSIMGASTDICKFIQPYSILNPLTIGITNSLFGHRR